MEATPQHIAAIHKFLDALGRRERAVLGVRTWVWVAALVLAGLLGASIGFSAGFSRLTVVLSLAVVCVPALVVLSARVLWPQWTRAGTIRWQARRVEARLPGLRSRMITVVDRAPDVAKGTSRFSLELWARAAAHAEAATGLIGVGDVHPWSRNRRSASTLVALLLSCFMAGSFLPVGPLDALDIVMGKSAAVVRLEAAMATSLDERVLVGDITLRYVYPDYMGLDPVEVPNSDGTIHAPPGTRVQISARSAEVFDAAAIQVDADAPLDAELAGGRDLSAWLTIEMEGAWRFLLFSGDEVQASPDYKILVEADQPPVVVTSETGKIAKAVDEPLNLRWQVTDDYGIASITMEITRDGETEVVSLRQPIDSVLELSGRVRRTPRRLGLAPGDEAVIQVVAIDSDKATGGNRGESEEIVLEVMGPKGVGRRLTAYHQKLRKALLIGLADFLEEAVPPAETPAGMLRWARKTRGRLDTVLEVYRAQWGDEQSQGVDGMVVRDVMDKNGRLYRFTVVTFDITAGNSVAGRKAVDRDYTTFAKLHGETVESLERAVWMIDEMLQQVAYREVARQAQDLAQETRELSEMAEEDPDSGVLLARLDQLERLMSKLQEAASRLSEGRFKEFVNSRMSEAQAQIDAIRQAIAEGRLEDAQALLDELADQLQQFAEGMQEQMNRSRQGDDELKQRYEQLIRDLEKLEADQKQLADELAAARQIHGGDFDQAMAVWEQLDQLSADAVKRSDAMLARFGDGRGLQSRTLQRAETTGQATHGTQDAIRARDAGGALERVYLAQRYSMMVEQAIRRERDRARPTGEGAPEGLDGAAQEVRRLSTILQEIRTLLEQLSEQPGESSPELEAAAQQLSGRQQALKQEHQALAEEVQTVERAMPTGDGSAQENMQGAGAAMESARGALDDGEAMQGEGHQREAARKLEAVRESLAQEMEQRRQMQREMQRMEGEGEGRHSPEDGEGQGDDLEQPEIPTPEAFETPEAYRRALLEGMAEDVPEEFEALKKRFYEELVRQ